MTKSELSNKILSLMPTAVKYHLDCVDCDIYIRDYTLRDVAETRAKANSNNIENMDEMQVLIVLRAAASVFIDSECTQLAFSFDDICNMPSVVCDELLHAVNDIDDDDEKKTD